MISRARVHARARKAAFRSESAAFSSYCDLGANIDYNLQVLLVQKVLRELARDPGSGKFKDLDQQREPMQKPRFRY
jgi:hypothetical protein